MKVLMHVCACVALFMFSLFVDGMPSVESTDDIHTTIVFDLPTVPSIFAGFWLLKTNMASYSGWPLIHLASCGFSSLVTGSCPTHLQEQLFEMLNGLELPLKMQEETQVDAFFQGAKVPAILAAYLKGEEMPGGTLQAVWDYIDGTDQNNSYKFVFKGIAKLIFTPSQLAQSVQADSDFIDSLRKIKQAQPDTRFLLASSLPNLDELRQQGSYQPLFALSDDVTSVRQVKKLRPDPAFYLALATQYSLDAKRTVFIENEPEYTGGVRAAGFDNALCWTGAGSIDNALDLIKP